MSAATDALLARRFADGALPAAPPALRAGELRVAGQTLSAGVVPLHKAERRVWVKNRSQATPGKWLQPCAAPLPADVSLDGLRQQLAKLLELPEVRERRRSGEARAARLRVLTPKVLSKTKSDLRKADSVPPLPRVSSRVEAFDIAADDDRAALRGQRGLRAAAPLPCGHLLGLLQGLLLTKGEWETLKWSPAGAGEKGGGAGGPQWLAQEIAIESYCHELTLPHHPNAAGYNGEEPQKLYLSSFGYANVLSLINDAHAVQRPGSPAPALRVLNCAFVELKLQGWPCLAIVTIAPVLLGEVGEC